VHTCVTLTEAQLFTILLAFIISQVVCLDASTHTGEAGSMKRIPVDPPEAATMEEDRDLRVAKAAKHT
jgi:hypothetical protein